MPGPVNDFLPFATAGGASVESQADYLADPTTPTGFNAGTAAHLKCNKVWRQSSFGVAVLMQYIAETLGTDSLDDGDLAAHVARLEAALAASGATNPPGVAQVIGLSGANNVTTPNSKFDLTALRAAMADSSGKVLFGTPGALTCDLGLAGPAVDGRDQAVAFPTDRWVYIYLITKAAGSVHSLASLSGPAAFNGSTLPATYTNWALAGILRLDGSGNIMKAVWNGETASYYARQQALSLGGATGETAISLSGLVPPEAGKVQLQLKASSTTGSRTVALRHKSGNDFVVIDSSTSIGGGGEAQQSLDVPNVGQNLYYQWSAAPGNGLTVHVLGFTMPNGG